MTANSRVTKVFEVALIVGLGAMVLALVGLVVALAVAAGYSVLRGAGLL